MMTFATIAILLLFVLVAIFPPRLHFGLRFLAIAGMAGLMWVLGAFVLQDVFLPVPFAPEDFLFAELDLMLLSIVCFAIGFLVAVLAWIVRKLFGGKAAPAA